MSFFKNNPFTYMLRQNWHYAGEGEHGRLIFFVALSVIAHLIQLSSPYVMGEVFNAIQAGGENVISNVAKWLLILGLIEFIFWVFHGPSRVIERNVAFVSRGRFIDTMYSKLRALPLKWHQDHHSGNTINRIRKAGDALQRFAGRYFSYIAVFTNLFGPILVLFWISWPVALVALVINIITLTALWRFDLAIMRWLDKENTVEHKFSATMFDYISNFTTIITLRLGGRTQKELAQKYQDIKPMFKPHVRINEWKYFILNMGSSVLVILVILAYIWNEYRTNAAIMVGTAVAVYRYLDMFRHAFFGFAGMYQNVLAEYTDFKSVMPILDEKVSLKQAKVDHKNVWQQAEIKGLNFSHDVEGEPTLSDIGFTFERGEKIALVGESGAGKSTLMAIMRGLYIPQNVELDLDGASYKTLFPLYDTTTLIPQDPEVFENTIHYNITVGIDYPKQDIEEAVKLSRFDRALKRLPNGLETDVREKGVSLSGGERQRLALARGILAAKNSDIILMDEPTSSVDAQNEMNIYTNIFSHFSDRTVISSIHRLHLLDKFDRIIVMDGGSIVQMGTFKALKKEKGLFKTLWSKYSKNA